VLSARHIALTRQIGALSALPIALSARMWLHLFRGELTDAAALIEQNEALDLATGYDIPHPFGTLGLAALEARELLYALARGSSRCAHTLRKVRTTRTSRPPR
jgi:hypothetical protein